MVKLLRKIKEYSDNKGYNLGLSLIIENDESGVLVDNPYQYAKHIEVFHFNSINPAQHPNDGVEETLVRLACGGRFPNQLECCTGDRNSIQAA